MRKAFLAAMALVTSMATFYAAAAGPAAAEPANADSSGAYGLAATGALAISPTITTASAFPPGGDNSVNGNFGGPSPTLLTLPLGTLALAGAVGVEANSHTADDITPELGTIAPVACAGSDCATPVTLTNVNTRGLAKTAGLGVVISQTGGSTISPIVTLLQTLPSLVTADAVTSEAVAKCVDGHPVFDTGFQVAGLGGLVGNLVNPAILDPVLALVTTLLGRKALLSDIVSISPGEVTALADGVAIEGLVVRVPLLNETIAISHSEVHMAANCAVVVAAQPTGPGPVAPTGGRLASTGADMAFLPIGLGLVGAAMVGAGFLRRSRRQSTATQ